MIVCSNLTITVLYKEFIVKFLFCIAKRKIWMQNLGRNLKRFWISSLQPFTIWHFNKSFKLVNFIWHSYKTLSCEIFANFFQSNAFFLKVISGETKIQHRKSFRDEFISTFNINLRIGIKKLDWETFFVISHTSRMPR